MTTRAEGDLVDLHIKVTRQQKEALSGFVRNEGCRSLREIMIYFLEVMIEVLKRHPRLHLPVKSYRYDRLTRDIRTLIDATLFESLDLVARDFGMQVPEITRVLLRAALESHQQLVPQGEVVNKEEFIALIETAVQVTADKS